MVTDCVLPGVNGASTAQDPSSAARSQADILSFSRLIWINPTTSQSALPTKGNKAYSQKMRSVAVSEEKKAEKTQAQILSDVFEGMKGRQPKSNQELNEWLATDEGKQATMFETTSISRWGEVGHS